MQTMFKSTQHRGAITGSLIFDMMEAPLSQVPFHQDTASIKRFFAANFPFHVAVHEVSLLHHPPAEYTMLHVHDDSDEINIIVSGSHLRYRIQLDDDTYEVNNNSCIWVPRGVWHSANVLKGSGFYITLRL